MRFWTLLLCIGLALAGTSDTPSSWTPGTPAANTAAVLTPAKEKVELPAWLVEKITGPTLVWYFNPNCGHCQASVGGVVRLAEEMKDKEGAQALTVIGIANSGASPAELKWFMDTYQVNFTLMIDQPRGFSYSVGARSTPTALVFEPDPAGGVFATDAYYPWFHGAELLVKIRRGGADPFSHFEEDRYVGNAACSACHSQEAASWKLSHHAVAYGTIYKADKAADPECVNCHVTGMGQAGGFVMGEHGHPLADVGCEACHSAGGPHDGKTVNATEQCESCHNKTHSIAFSVEKGLPHIDHYKVNGMSAGEQEQRRHDLANGKAERPLLAFPHGKNLGPEQCESCHADAVKAWSKGPHAGAMDLLKGKEKKDLACVSCHATAVESGLPPTSLDGFQTQASVSCGSCHGPGEPHLTSPDKESIEGLGEDCPVCVIEAVCTGCHDSEQDPGWDLETALARQKGHGQGAPEGSALPKTDAN
jgi:hypothetical protein